MTGYSMICVGGSSGSIEVLHDILASLPRNFDVPITMALHRHIESRDTLMRLLRSNGMPAIVEPYDKDVLSNGAVYLAPPNYHMMVEAKSICLSNDEPENFARPSIDILFESVAHVFGPRSLGIILSGASEDGAYGAALLRQRGGHVIVQDPAAATVPVLPEATLRQVPAAMVLPVPDIIGFLLQNLT